MVTELVVVGEGQTEESLQQHINDGQMTHPSARLGRVLNEPGYDKRVDGPTVATGVGLERISAECRHFGQWLGRLEALPPLCREPIW